MEQFSIEVAHEGAAYSAVVRPDGSGMGMVYGVTVSAEGAEGAEGLELRLWVDEAQEWVQAPEGTLPAAVVEKIGEAIERRYL